jgi:glycosyltransferase involved in cell wall biosynthesis
LRYQWNYYYQKKIILDIGGKSVDLKIGMTKISIAVPSYNYAQYLSECLESIQQQDYQDFEVLIADGGSNDGSLEIIEQFCNEDLRFKLVSTSDEGQADSIHKAFYLASGEVLCFLNADDCYLSDDVLSSVIKAFEVNEKIDIISFGGHYLDANGHLLRPINLRYHPFDGFHLMRYRTAIIQPATFWRTKVYDPDKWPSNFNFVFDVVFFYQVYLQYKWLELAKPVAGYRLHGKNKSMLVKSARIKELAAFEAVKFGSPSFRQNYLQGVAEIVKVFETWGKTGSYFSKALYIIVNGLAYLTIYRLPGI